MTNTDHNTLAAELFAGNDRLARARDRVAEVRAWFDALDDVVLAMWDATPNLIQVAHAEADAALNDALNEQDAAEQSIAA
jgi:hypothetical protein